MLMAITIFMLSAAEDMKIIGTLDTARMALHQ